jgi:PAS domain S-box-containing protein
MTPRRHIDTEPAMWCRQTSRRVPWLSHEERTIVTDSQDREQLAQLLLDSTGEGIYGIDLDGNCTFANPACLEILGFETDTEILGVNMHDLVHHTLPNGDPYPMTECQIYRAFREGKGVHVDTEVMWRSDGTNFDAEYWSYPTHQDGELVGSVLTFTDISERKWAERERKRAAKKLRDSESQVRLLLNSTGEGIYGVDLDGNCTFANSACVRILGFETDNELLGATMHDLVHHHRADGTAYPMEECRIYRAFQNGEGVHVDDEVMFRSDGTSFPAEYWSYPMDQDGEAVGSVLTFVDITERRQLEAQLADERDRVKDERDKVKAERDTATRLQKKADELLLNVLPFEIAERLKKYPGRTIAERFDEVTALFADLVGFTPLSARLSPDHAVELLNEVFTAFDDFAAELNLEKIKSMGDGYMIVAGAPTPMDRHCDTIARLAIKMRDWMDDRDADDGIKLRVRIGIDSGSAVGAVIGKKKFAYDMWGDTINVASRMESSGEPGRIQIGPGAYERLRGGYVLEPRGAIDIKGKGKMETWFLESPR